VHDHMLNILTWPQILTMTSFLHLPSFYETEAGNKQGSEHSVAYVKYYQTGAEDKWTNSQKLTWARQRRHGGGEGFWYDVIDVENILGPVFIVPNFADRDQGSGNDAFYVCPWQR
jgi:hypothetical protein